MDRLSPEEIASHRLVCQEYGTDVSLAHRPSGVTIHLRSQFLGRLSSSFLDEKLGDCHMPIEAILAFFDLTSFNPVNPDVTSISPQEWVYVTLIADLLGLPHGGPMAHGKTPLMPVRVGTVDPERAYSPALRFVLEHMHLHSEHVALDVIMAICTTIGRAWSLDAAHAFGLIRNAASLDAGTSAACFFLLGGGRWDLLFSSHSRSPAATPDQWYDASAIRVVDSQTVLNFLGRSVKERHVMPSRTFPVLSAYVCGTDITYEDLPFTIERGKRVKLQSKTRETTIHQIFGLTSPFDVGNALIVPCEPSALGLVKYAVVATVHDDWSLTLLFPRLRTSPPAVNDRFRIESGRLCGYQTISSVFVDGETGNSTVYALDTFKDPFGAAANFTIKVGGDEGGDCVVHDWVLYYRWEYFKRAIDAGLSEASSRVMTLPAGFPRHLLSAIVKHIYGVYAFDASEQSEEVASYLRENAELYGLAKEDANGALVAQTGWAEALLSLTRRRNW